LSVAGRRAKQSVTVKVAELSASDEKRADRCFGLWRELALVIVSFSRTDPSVDLSGLWENIAVYD
jgi:hypothetical protein